MQRIEEHERNVIPISCRGIKIGGGSRMKVLAEIMDAPRQENIRDMVERFFAQGADIVDLGFGFDATQGDVRQVFSDLDGIDRPLAADTQDPDLIRAAPDGLTSSSACRKRISPGSGKPSRKPVLPP